MQTGDKVTHKNTGDIVYTIGRIGLYVATIFLPDALIHKPTTPRAAILSSHVVLISNLIKC